MKVSNMSLKDEAAAQALLATPSGGVATLTLLGYNLSDWIVIGTAVLIVLQIGFLLHKWVKFATEEKVCPSETD